MIKKIFHYQSWHLLILIVLLITAQWIIITDEETKKGCLWGINTHIWFNAALLLPIVHQVYVLIIWRLALHSPTFLNKLGFRKTFKLYSVGFSILFILRLASIVLVAFSNKNTLSIVPKRSYILVSLIILLVSYIFYSVARYFTFKRAYGIDHFIKNFRKPLVKKGIFRFTSNGMYMYGFLMVYLPSLLLFSKAALIIGIFNHLYIWVHYYCTERPDMEFIYKRKKN